MAVAPSARLTRKVPRPRGVKTLGRGRNVTISQDTCVWHMYINERASEHIFKNGRPYELSHANNAKWIAEDHETTAGPAIERVLTTGWKCQEAKRPLHQKVCPMFGASTLQSAEVLLTPSAVLKPCTCIYSLCL